MSNVQTCSRKVLVSGASVAGLTLAYWLNRSGSDVTVVERASAVRSDGYPRLPPIRLDVSARS